MKNRINKSTTATKQKIANKKIKIFILVCELGVMIIKSGDKKREK